LSAKKSLNFADHPINGSIGELRVDRQGEDLPRHPLAVAQSGRPRRNAAAIGGMQVHWDGVMNAGADRRSAQMLAQPIAFLAVALLSASTKL